MRLFYVSAAARFEVCQTKWVFYFDNRSCCWWPFYWSQLTTNLEAPLKWYLISPWVDTDIEVKMKLQKCISTKWWELRTALGRSVWTRRHVLWLAEDVTSVWTCICYRTNRDWWGWGGDRRQGKGFMICIPCQNIRVIKSRRMRCVGHVACMGEKRNAYRVLVGEHEGKIPLWRPRTKWEGIVKIEVKDIG
jgi:hypothetical protein